MMRAAVDVGTNTVRLLIGKCRKGRIEPLRYFRRITRLGGAFSPEKGLDPAAKERTLSALSEAAEILASQKITEVDAVGTAALRAACDGAFFASVVRERTGIPLRIIEGKREAFLSARGVLAALDPLPHSCFIIDIGGGSTEIILWKGGKIAFSRSFPLGVVSLCEKCASSDEEQRRIDRCLDELQDGLAAAGISEFNEAPLVGTAGTITTLAAVKQRMTEYDWRRINNSVLTRCDLVEIGRTLEELPLAERETVPGMEQGRGDLILPGLRIVTSVLDRLGRDRLAVSDFGLLEGILLDACESPDLGRNH